MILSTNSFKSGVIAENSGPPAAAPDDSGEFEGTWDAMSVDGIDVPEGGLFVERKRGCDPDTLLIITRRLNLKDDV